MFKRVSSLLVALALVWVTGCSKAPEAEMQASDVAVQAAQQAEAPEYAPEAFKTAQDTLQAAQAALKEQESKFSLFRSYDQTKALYEASKRLADDAAAQAAANKEMIRNEVSAMVVTADSLLTAADNALTSAPRGKGSKADLELMKNDLAAIRTAQAEAVGEFNSGKYLVAKSRLESVVSRVQTLLSEIEAARSMTGAKKS